jgi:hypothetical protein
MQRSFIRWTPGEHGALTWINGKTVPNAATTVTTTRTEFESDFKSGFPVVEPVGLSQRGALIVNPSHSPANRTSR